MWTLDIVSELGVVGCDAEMADASNPRGEIIREVWFVTATGAGEVYAHIWTTESESEARGWLGSIRKSVARTDGWNPAGREAWRHWRNLYGSSAYEAGEADLAATEKRNALDEEAWRDQ